MPEAIETVIVGGGQAGLAMSYHLRECGREHVILERSRIAERWHSERWDSFRFQFPNWSLQLPDYAYAGEGPDAFADRIEVARFIESYARHIAAPVRSGVNVDAVTTPASKARFRLDTTEGVIHAHNVVVATGPFQQPSVPSWASEVPGHVVQLHSRDYRSADALPDGAILVVGSGSSGSQIAMDLALRGRRVFLTISRHRRIPRRYRGKDLLYWFFAMGRIDARFDDLPGGRIPPGLLMTGADGGYDLDVRRFPASGIEVLGRVAANEGGRLALSDDLESYLAFSDAACAEFRSAVDRHIIQAGLDAPAADEAESIAATTPASSREALDLGAERIAAIVWCTGYGCNFGWIDAPVFDQRGLPRQRRGVTECDGLYFLGLHWMYRLKSGTLFGVGEDAAFLAERISRA